MPEWNQRSIFRCRWTFHKDAWDVMWKVLFGPHVLGCSTIVRTRFTKFTEPEEVRKDKEKLTRMSGAASRIVSHIKNIIYVDNPPPEYSDWRRRKMSRDILLEHLVDKCQTVFRPPELDQVNKEIDVYVEEVLQSQETIKRLETELKEVREKLSADQKIFQLGLRRRQQESEDARKAAEDARKAAEGARKEAEDARKENQEVLREQTRLLQEKLKEAENARKAAEGAEAARKESLKEFQEALRREKSLEKEKKEAEDAKTKSDQTVTEMVEKYVTQKGVTEKIMGSVGYGVDRSAAWVYTKMTECLVM